MKHYAIYGRQNMELCDFFMAVLLELQYMRAENFPYGSLSKDSCLLRELITMEA
jgi:hypothetical protein